MFELDPFTRVFVTIAVIILGVFVMLIFASWLKDFSLELRYLNNEIKRTRGREQEHWIRERRKLWMSILPFVKY